MEPPKHDQPGKAKAVGVHHSRKGYQSLLNYQSLKLYFTFSFPQWYVLALEADWHLI
jgi:hypothetical protein